MGCKTSASLWSSLHQSCCTRYLRRWEVVASTASMREVASFRIINPFFSLTSFFFIRLYISFHELTSFIFPFLLSGITSHVILNTCSVCWILYYLFPHCCSNGWCSLNFTCSQLALARRTCHHHRPEAEPRTTSMHHLASMYTMNMFSSISFPYFLYLYIIYIYSLLSTTTPLQNMMPFTGIDSCFYKKDYNFLFSCLHVSLLPLPAPTFTSSHLSCVISEPLPCKGEQPPSHPLESFSSFPPFSSSSSTIT